MSKKRKKEKSKDVEFEEFGQDSEFFFIAGFTSGGAPYGITWEEAYADGLIERSEVNDEIENNEL